MSKIKFYGTMTRNNVEKKRKEKKKKGKKKESSLLMTEGDGSGLFLEARVW